MTQLRNYGIITRLSLNQKIIGQHPQGSSESTHSGFGLQVAPRKTNMVLIHLGNVLRLGLLVKSRGVLGKSKGLPAHTDSERHWGNLIFVSTMVSHDDERGTQLEQPYGWL